VHKERGITFKKTAKTSRSSTLESSLLGDIRLPESARGKRIATENGARNNPRRNNAARQIWGGDSALAANPVENPMLITRPAIFRRSR